MRNCVHCLQPIPERRLVALPHTNTCVNCSRVQAPVCFQIPTGKNTSEFFAIPAENTEGIRQATNVLCRAKGKDAKLKSEGSPLSKCFKK